jgi:hypothetical protein
MEVPPMGFSVEQTGLGRWIRSRSREQWLEHWREKYTDIRIWIQEHSEKAFIIGLVGGALLVLLFRAVFWLLFICALIGLAIWLYARSEGAPPPDGSQDSSKPGSVS